jgi:hypothetical protein
MMERGDSESTKTLQVASIAKYSGIKKTLQAAPFPEKQRG